MNERVPGLETPLRCGRCLHTVRDGEQYEDRMWETNSAGPVPGVVHTPACPTGLPRVQVPCAPCLAQLLVGCVAEPHVCRRSTLLRIEGGHLIVAPKRRCPCPCQKPQRFQESETLRAARSAARGTTDE